MSPLPAHHGPLSSNLHGEAKSPERQPAKWHQRLSRLFGRDDASTASAGLQNTLPPTSNLTDDATSSEPEHEPPTALCKQTSARSRLGRPVIPGLPRPPTFRRQMSERRERLSPSDIPHSERRTVSVDRRRAFSTRPASPSAFPGPTTSAPAVYDLSNQESTMRGHSIPPLPQQDLPQRANINAMLLQRPTNPPTPPPDVPSHVPSITSRRSSTAIDIQDELESKWILNLSMHFRDKSPREKFFVTYAETSTRWRRVTVSCDYRNAPRDSLEADLHALSYQRDKSARIYDAIRTSLPDIQFYDTVTNLRLETSPDERLHVHVTEDVNEIIPYPDQHLLSHLGIVPRIPEEKVHFLNHMSGFVYKVRVDNEVLIKKEIPGPDSVEEFLYEINALSSLVGSETVVQIRGLVVDNETHAITGLLIDYYEQGPLVDILFDHRGALSWERRGKWAKQIIQGLAEIHEAGFVQGDFTVSNICVGADDNARIIDINRRGCPVGWEPPEIAAMIESGQRISMYIGVKSDLFQLGMVLWAMANEDDEPERRERPLRLSDSSGDGQSDPAPSWYRHITHLCLETQPCKRPSANKLLDSAFSAWQASPASSHRGPLAETTTHTWTSASTAVPPLSLSQRDEGKGSSPSISSSLDNLPRGRSPPRNTAHLGADWHWPRLTDSNNTQGENADEQSHKSDPENDGVDAQEEAGAPEPEIVPIDPTAGGWREITVDGQAYIVRDESYDALPEFYGEDYVEGGRRHDEIAFGEDAFGHQFVPSLIPHAPEVPQAPEPPSAPLPRAFQHIDSGLADMHISDQLEDQYRQFAFTSTNHAPSNEYQHYPDTRQFHFNHHDSGLGGMELDHDVDHHLHPHPEEQHAHRSGRRTFSQNKPESKMNVEEKHTLPDVREEEPLSWQEVHANGEESEDGGAESENGEHHGGVSLNLLPGHEQVSKDDRSEQTPVREAGSHLGRLQNSMEHSSRPIEAPTNYGREEFQHANDTGRGSHTA